MSDEDLRKLAGFIVDAVVARLSGAGPGLASLVEAEREPEIDPEEQKRAEAEYEQLRVAWEHITGVNDG